MIIIIIIYQKKQIFEKNFFDDIRDALNDKAKYRFSIYRNLLFTFLEMIDEPNFI